MALVGLSCGLFCLEVGWGSDAAQGRWTRGDAVPIGVDERAPFRLLASPVLVGAEVLVRMVLGWGPVAALVLDAWRGCSG